VPDTIAEFISQRRRWLNGSLLSSSYALIHTFNILKTDHSTTRKVVLLFEAFYNLLNMLFAWFGFVKSRFMKRTSTNVSTKQNRQLLHFLHGFDNFTPRSIVQLSFYRASQRSNAVYLCRNSYRFLPHEFGK
jgi:chitin synthase